MLEKVSLSACSVFIDGELLAEMVRHGFTITEIPIEYHPRQAGSSNFDSFGAAWDTLREMVQYYAQRHQISLKNTRQAESKDA